MIVSVIWKIKIRNFSIGPLLHLVVWQVSLPWKIRVRPRKNRDRDIRCAESYSQIDKNQKLVRNISFVDLIRAPRTVPTHTVLTCPLNSQLSPDQIYKHLRYNNNTYDVSLHFPTVFSRFNRRFADFDWSANQIRRNRSFVDTCLISIIEFYELNQR